MMAPQFLHEYTSAQHAAKFSGFSFATGQAGHRSEIGFGGRLEPDEASPLVTDHTRFDLASLTKLYTGALAAVMDSAGLIEIDAPLSSWAALPTPLSSLTTAEILTHTSGLPAVWEERDTRAGTIAELLSLIPDPQQKGELVYSCTGYTLFAVCVEQMFSKRFDEILHEYLLGPIGLAETGFLPTAATNNIAVSCEPSEAFGSGTVHDPRARSMDGVSGNAGLFGTADDVFLFLSELANGHAGVVTEAARAQLFTPRVKGEWEQAIGFRFHDKARVGDTSQHFSHTGFTGTLAMVDPQTQDIKVLLTNRLVCETTRDQMAPIYRAFAASTDSVI